MEIIKYAQKIDLDIKIKARTWIVLIKYLTKLSKHDEKDQ